MTGDITFGNNVDANFGATSDLKIHSDGGTVYLTGNDIRFRSETGAEPYFSLAVNGGPLFKHNALDKLEVTSTGVSITGTAVATTDTDTSNTGTVTLDFAANQNFVLTLTGAVTLANPSTEQVGQSGFITFIQDGTGGRVVSLGTDYETAAAAGLTLSTAANTTDIVPYIVVAANRVLLGTPQLAFA